MSLPENEKTGLEELDFVTQVCYRILTSNYCV